MQMFAAISIVAVGAFLGAYLDISGRARKPAFFWFLGALTVIIAIVVGLW